MTKILKSTHPWIIVIFRTIPPCYTSDIVGPLGSGLIEWKLVCHVPPGIPLLISSDVFIIFDLKQPSNKSSIPFKKSEINKYFLTWNFRYTSVYGNLLDLSQAHSMRYR